MGRSSWSNWAGNVSAHGIRVNRPADADEVAEIVRRAALEGRRVKAIGTGHSFSEIGRPEEEQIVLDRLTGQQDVNAERATVTVGAGTSLRRLSELAAGAGLALSNLGDVDVQTIAGAISTGTHGTGLAYGGLSTQVCRLEMVLADGTIVRCSGDERPELWSAARVGLGALGILTKVTVRCVPLFAIRAEEGPLRLDELLARFDELVAGYDHFEAYWWPHTRMTLAKRNTRVPLADGLDRLPAWREWLDDELLSNTVFGIVVRLGVAAPPLVPALNRIASRALGSRAFTDLSYRVFTSPRRVRFREMECALPLECAAGALREVVRAIGSSGMRVAFPVEIRVAAADDIPLSTAYGRDTVYLAFHVPAAVDHRQYFRLVSRALEAYGPRPHWGKLHTLDAGALRTRYPRFDEFVALRDRLDPQRVFSNHHLERILGP